MNASKNYGLAPFQSPKGWARISKVTNLVDKKTKELVGIRVENEDKSVTVPVIDATLSERNQRIAKAMVKYSNPGSKFIKPSYSAMGRSYNASQKQ